jgi:hypothetical protein
MLLARAFGGLLEMSVVFFRQIVDDVDKEIFTDQYHALMIKIMKKYYNTTNTAINKQNITKVTRQIMSVDQLDKPLRFKTTKYSLKFKISMTNCQFIYQVLKALKLNHLQK